MITYLIIYIIKYVIIYIPLLSSVWQVMDHGDFKSKYHEDIVENS